jgi:hypothetical protein
MYSRPAQELALKLGLHDANFVDQLGWMERAKKHWERVSLVSSEPSLPHAAKLSQGAPHFLGTVGTREAQSKFL